MLTPPQALAAFGLAADELMDSAGVSGTTKAAFDSALSGTELTQPLAHDPQQPHDHTLLTLAHGHDGFHLM